MRYLVLALFTLMLTTCGGATPPNVMPSNPTAYRATRVIRALELVLDTAIAANATQPPLLSEATTRRVVLTVKSLATVTHAAQAGWTAAVQTGLGELNAGLGATERTQLGPYIVLTQTLLKELVP